MPYNLAAKEAGRYSFQRKEIHSRRKTDAAEDIYGVIGPVSSHLARRSKSVHRCVREVTPSLAAGECWDRLYYGVLSVSPMFKAGAHGVN
eukprot:539595-Pleurochrysis_carterae.AAC.3